MYSRALEHKPARPNTAFGFAALNQWLWSTSIVTQMGRLFNVFAILAVVIASFALIGTYRMDVRADRLSDFTKVAFLTAKMNREVNLAKDDFGTYRAFGFNADLLDQSIKHTRNAHEAAIELRGFSEPFGSSYLANVEDISTKLQRAEVLLNEATAIPPDQMSDEALLGPRYEALDDANASIETLREIAEQRANEVSGLGIEEIENLFIALSISLVFALGMAMVGKSFVARRLVAPIAQISEVSSRISRGESELQIPGAERQDEIGKLAQSLEVLRRVQAKAANKAMNELEDQKALEQERERQQAEKAALLTSLAQSFEASIGDVALEVANASDDVSSAAQSLAHNVDRSSSRVEVAGKSLAEASHGMTSAASASDEFALAISEVSSQAAVSSERARKAAEAAKSADQTISELTDSADKISQIVELISRIAQRTNLLALNAAIEAARSAEAGRGFAVVANEVKELAAQTHRETARVESLIVSMQNATGQSASALSTIAQEVIELQSASSAIASAVDQQAGAGQALAQAIDLAANNTVQFGDSIADVGSMMSASKMTAEQLSDSSDRLNAQIGRLRRHVTEFLEQVRSA